MKSNIKKLLGQKIKKVRQSKKISQEELAEKIGIASRTLCGIENGENFMTAETLDKIVDALEISVEDLFQVNYLKPQADLVEEIVQDVRAVRSREKIEIIYRFIKSIIQM